MSGFHGEWSLLVAINDAAVGAAMIVELGAGGRVDPRVIGILQGWMAAGEAPAIKRLSRAWEDFKRCKRLFRNG